ncbi:MAG: SDR family oxidoreductase [Actinobacteria bacterium]|nr:SDR family oxidoreductase [Actinomycetota bacterium]
MEFSGTDFVGKVVAVTGGARGIGLETVKLLAGNGAKVAAGDLDLPLLREALAGVSGETAAFALDVTDRGSFQEFIDGAEAKFGPIDVLVNNAGVMSLSPFIDEPDSVSERQFDINVLGPMYGMKIVIPRMLERGRGHVINVASSAGRFGVPGAATYSASKFGVLGMTEAAGAEYARTPLKFTAICPVVVQTELTSGVVEKTRGVPLLQAHEVAEAIGGAIVKPKQIVYVPGNVRFTYLLSLMLPAFAHRLLARVTKADRLLTEIDVRGRSAYQRRAFGSATDEAKGDAGDKAA